MRLSRIWRILQIKEGVIHRGRRLRWITPSVDNTLLLKGVSPLRSLFFRSPNITQPCPQVFSVNGSIICGGLHFWRHFDIIGSIIFGGLRFWRHWFNMAKILSNFGQQQLVMVNYACGFNQSETGKYFEWIIIKDIKQSKRWRRPQYIRLIKALICLFFICLFIYLFTYLFIFLFMFIAGEP